MSKVVCAYVCCIFSATSILNIFGAFLNIVTWLTILVLDLVLFLCFPFLSIMISFLCGFSTPGITWGCSSCVSSFPSIIIFGNFSFFGVTVKFLLLIGKKNGSFLLDLLVVFPLGIPLE